MGATRWQGTAGYVQWGCYLMKKGSWRGVMGVTGWRGAAEGE